MSDFAQSLILTAMNIKENYYADDVFYAISYNGGFSLDRADKIISGVSVDNAKNGSVLTVCFKSFSQEGHKIYIPSEKFFLKGSVTGKRICSFLRDEYGIYNTTIDSKTFCYRSNLHKAITLKFDYEDDALVCRATDLPLETIKLDDISGHDLTGSRKEADTFLKSIIERIKKQNP